MGLPTSSSTGDGAPASTGGTTFQVIPDPKSTTLLARERLSRFFLRSSFSLDFALCGEWSSPGSEPSALTIGDASTSSGEPLALGGLRPSTSTPAAQSASSAQASRSPASLSGGVLSTGWRRKSKQEKSKRTISTPGSSCAWVGLSPPPGKPCLSRATMSCSPESGDEPTAMDPPKELLEQSVAAWPALDRSAAVLTSDRSTCFGMKESGGDEGDRKWARWSTCS